METRYPHEVGEGKAVRLMLRPQVHLHLHAASLPASFQSLAHIAQLYRPLGWELW